MNELDKKIEAILFIKGEPTSAEELAKIFSVTKDEIIESAKVLQEKLTERGIRLIIKENEFVLTTAPELSHITSELIKKEFNSDLSKSSLEVLAIIVYKGPIKRSEVDYIRGVNSTYTVRNLMIRGLVERITDPNDSRSFIYKPTMQLMQYLGITKLEDLPDFDSFNKKIDNFVQEQEVVDGSNTEKQENDGNN